MNRSTLILLTLSILCPQVYAGSCDDFSAQQVLDYAQKNPGATDLESRCGEAVLTDLKKHSFGAIASCLVANIKNVPSDASPNQLIARAANKCLDVLHTIERKQMNSAPSQDQNIPTSEAVPD